MESFFCVEFVTIEMYDKDRSMNMNLQLKLRPSSTSIVHSKTDYKQSLQL